MKFSGITMVIRSLMGGGAERVMCTMANHWVGCGVSVTIITSVSPDLDAYYLDPRVKRVWLEPSNSLPVKLGFPWNIRLLRRALLREGNRLVISFMDRSNIPVLLATRRTSIRVVIAERIDPRTQSHSYFKRLLMHIFYPQANALVVLTDSVKYGWADSFLPQEKVHVIHNPVLPLNSEEESLEWLPEKFFCCMGRLHRQKGFDMLFDILPNIFKRWPEYKLVILGEGRLRKQLEKQAQELGIAHRIIMPGFIKNPHAILQKSSIFIFPSRFEGFPNALVEAMALGLPVVSFDCPSGPNCLIKNNKNGIIVPPNDLKKLAEGIEYYLEHPQEAKKMGDAAQLVKKQCSPEHVLGMWTILLEGVLENKPNLHKELAKRAEVLRNLF